MERSLSRHLPKEPVAKQRRKLSFLDLRDQISLLSLGNSHKFVVVFLLNSPIPFGLWKLEGKSTCIPGHQCFSALCS